MHMQELDRNYAVYIPGDFDIVAFQEDTIELQLPERESKAKSGWKIKELKTLTVREWLMHNFGFLFKQSSMYSCLIIYHRFLKQKQITLSTI